MQVFPAPVYHNPTYSRKQQSLPSYYPGRERKSKSWPGHNIDKIALEVVKDVLQLITSHDTEVGSPGG